MDDVRVCCKFCFEWRDVKTPAVYVAPQHTGGDTDVPATWIPICDECSLNWYEDLSVEETLPMFRFNSL